MEELEIQIEVILDEMQGLENRIDDFSRYNRMPSKQDRFKQISMLAEWRTYNDQLHVLNELKETIISNGKK